MASRCSYDPHSLFCLGQINPQSFAVLPGLLTRLIVSPTVSENCENPPYKRLGGSRRALGPTSSTSSSGQKTVTMTKVGGPAASALATNATTTCSPMRPGCHAGSMQSRAHAPKSRCAPAAVVLRGGHQFAQRAQAGHLHLQGAEEGHGGVPADRCGWAAAVNEETRSMHIAQPACISGAVRTRGSNPALLQQRQGEPCCCTHICCSQHTPPSLGHSSGCASGRCGSAAVRTLQPQQTCGQQRVAGSSTHHLS